MLDNVIAAAAVVVLALIVDLAIMCCIHLIGAIPLYFMWNLAIPQVFGLPVITYWQAFAISWLIGIIFGSARAVLRAPEKK